MKHQLQIAHQRINNLQSGVTRISNSLSDIIKKFDNYEDNKEAILSEIGELLEFSDWLKNQ